MTHVVNLINRDVVAAVDAPTPLWSILIPVIAANPVATLVFVSESWDHSVDDGTIASTTVDDFPVLDQESALDA